MQGYCVKEKTKREIVNAQQVTLKNGKIAVKGKCKVCGTTMFVLGKKLQ